MQEEVLHAVVISLRSFPDSHIHPLDFYPLVTL